MRSFVGGSFEFLLLFLIWPISCLAIMANGVSVRFTTETSPSFLFSSGAWLFAIPGFLGWLVFMFYVFVIELKSQRKNGEIHNRSSRRRQLKKKKLK